MATFCELNHYRIFPSYSEFILVFFGDKPGNFNENHEHEVYHNKIWAYLIAKASDYECSIRIIKAKGKVLVKRRVEKRLIHDRVEKG